MPESITFVCEFFKWTDDYVLNMPAKRFFTFSKQAHKLKVERDAEYFMELCDIMAVAGCTSEYKDSLKSVYRARITGKKAERPVFEPDDERAVGVIMGMFQAKKQVMGLV